MSLKSRMFAASYDHMLKKAEKAGLAAQRGELLATARGRPPATRGGAGRPWPPPAPGPAGHRGPARRASAASPTATVLRAPAEELPFDDARFDVVVSTLALCTVRDQPRALAEIR